MKYKIIIITFLLLISNFIFSQKKILVTYVLTDLKTHLPIESMDEKTKKFFHLTLEKSKEIEYLLLINGNLSYFETEKYVLNENEFNKDIFFKSHAQLFTSFNKFVFANHSSDSLIFKRNLAGQDFIVKSKKNDLNWLLIEDKKKIMDYEVKKAIGKYYSPTLKVETDIEAWYIPSIPVQSGPDIFMGLPGLIVEVHLKGAIITASKIEFIDEINIPKIEESKAISQEKYEKIIDDLTKKYIEN